MALLHLSFTSKYLAAPADINVVLPDLPYGTDPKDFYKPGKKYKCCLQLYVNEKKVTDEDAIFKIRISD